MIHRQKRPTYKLFQGFGDGLVGAAASYKHRFFDILELLWLPAFQESFASLRLGFPATKMSEISH